MGDEGEEDPVILQALADTLMDAYHTREQLQNVKHILWEYNSVAWINNEM